MSSCVAVAFAAALVAVAAALSADPAPATPVTAGVTSDSDYVGAIPFPRRSELTSSLKLDAAGNLIGYSLTIPDFFDELPQCNLTIDPNPASNFAAIPFDVHPDMPFLYNGFFWNPCGHEGPANQPWQVPHFDLHLYTVPQTFTHGITCSSFDPITHVCTGTDYEVARFANVPNADFLPPTYVGSPFFWVTEMGAHTAPLQYLTDPSYTKEVFQQNPANLYLTYDGQSIAHEPMLAETIFADVKANGPRTFSWPLPKSFAVPGKYYTQYTLSYDQTAGAFTIDYENLITAPRVVNGFGVFQAETDFVIGDGVTAVSVSNQKDCLIAVSSTGVADAGYTTVTSDGDVVCCRARNNYDTVNNQCSKFCSTSKLTESALILNGKTCLWRCVAAN